MLSASHAQLEVLYAAQRSPSATALSHGHGQNSWMNQIFRKEKLASAFHMSVNVCTQMYAISILYNVQPACRKQTSQKGRSELDEQIRTCPLGGVGMPERPNTDIDCERSVKREMWSYECLGNTAAWDRIRREDERMRQVCNSYS